MHKIELATFQTKLKIIICGIFLLIALVSSAYSRNLPTIAIVTTGGTIAEKTDPKTGGAVPAVSGADLIKAVPELTKLAKIKVVSFSNIDSSQMTPQLWLRLSKVVDKLLKDPKINGVVITHGTDTMSVASFFLDLTIKTKKPVVFTGAMRDASMISSDGAGNLYSAVLQATTKPYYNWGVTVTLNQYINSARDVRKTRTDNVQTFNSGEKGYLGYIATGKVTFFHNRRDILHLPRPQKLPKIALLFDYAGADGSLVRAAVKSGAKGIVIDGVGAGNVNAKVYKAIQYALHKGIAVVITTRVPNQGVYPIYGDQGGGATLQRAGVIMGGTLSGPKARILLMLTLPQVGDNHKKLVAYFSGMHR